MSAAAYFGFVALVTALGFAGAMHWRPAFSHFVLQSAGLERVPQASPGSFYTVRVAPLLEARCTGCHGSRVQKAQLRLDSFAGTTLGGKHGAVIQPGDAKHSELFTRISLPASDDRAMPPSGKTPLTRDEVTVIRLWIAAGASGTQPVGAIKGAPKRVVEVKISDVDPRRVQKQRAPLAATVRQLQSRFPGVIAYEAQDTADLDINASLKGPSFGDPELRALMPLAARIVTADFSGTAITDASAPVLAAMTSLRSLRLMNTKITNKTIEALAPLKALKSLTVTGTGAKGEALATLRGRGVAVHGDGDAQ
jgi:Planctomycete cytochrome C